MHFVRWPHCKRPRLEPVHFGAVFCVEAGLEALLVKH
jgi:hypothetical protein